MNSNHPSFLSFRCSILLGLAWLLPSGVFAQAITPPQRQQASHLAEEVLVAGKLYAEGNYSASAAKITELQTELVALLKDSGPELQRLLKPTFQRIARAHSLLELEGAELATLPNWEKLTDPTTPKPTAPEGSPTTPESSNVSFVRQVAPWLVSSCGKCHIDNRRGEFSMSTFESLLAGSKGGVVLFAGSARSSRLVDVIESGDMPRGGGRIAPEQVALLKQWIDQGAQFDGPSPRTPLTALVADPLSAPNTPSTTPVNPPTATPAALPMSADSVSFSKTIAPILLANCQGCHIGAQQNSGGLRMDNFSQLTRGGDSGAIVQPNQAAVSLLVQKLKGEAGNRMPAGGRPPLSNDEINAISKWIDQGAPFDGPSEEMNIETVINQVWAGAAQHDELFQRRQQRAQERWTRVLPNDEPATLSDSELFLLGNVPPDRLEKTLKQFQEATAQAKKLLGAPADQPLLKGGLIVFLLKSRYDYSEFGRMTESRELPKDWLGHWHADPLDVYGVIADDNQAADQRAADKQSSAVALQIVVGAYLGSFPEVPRWFAEGVARNLVKNSFRRGDGRVSQWQQNYPSALLKVDKAETLLEGRLDEESSGLVGMGITGFMMERTNRRRFDQLLEQLRSGQPFDAACTAQYAPPATLVTTWLGK